MIQKRHFADGKYAQRSVTSLMVNMIQKRHFADGEQDTEASLRSWGTWYRSVTSLMGNMIQKLMGNMPKEVSESPQDGNTQKKSHLNMVGNRQKTDHFMA